MGKEKRNGRAAAVMHSATGAERLSPTKKHRNKVSRETKELLALGDEHRERIFIVIQNCEANEVSRTRLPLKSLK